MTTTQVEAPGGATVAQGWLARVALVAAGAAVLVAPVVAGLRQSLALVLVGLAGLAVALAGAWAGLAHQGPVRWLAAALAVAAPLGVLVLYTSRGLLWVVLVALGLLAVAVAAGRAALAGQVLPERMGEHQVPPPRRPFLIMNPRSGGGKVVRFASRSGPRPWGQRGPARGAGAGGCGRAGPPGGRRPGRPVGVAGGDGTQPLVAGIAAEHDLPLLVIAAGTRNHFALDLGVGPGRPSRGLDALVDGWSCGWIWGHRRPPVRQQRLLRGLRGGGPEPGLPRRQAPHHPGAAAGAAGRPPGPRLVARAGNLTIEGPQAVLVSNNVYGLGDLAGLGRRARLDRGTLGLVAVTVASAVQAAGLVRGTQSRGLTRLAAPEVVIDADTAQVPMALTRHGQG